jgi:membrane protease YdiL (CAAX protease family)
VEAFVILFFLVAGVTTVLALVQPILSSGPSDSAWRAALLGVTYLAYLALALVFPYRQAARARGDAWRLLGLHALPVVQALRLGLRTYAIFWALLALPLRLYLGSLLAAGSPLLPAGEAGWTYAVYFLLLCLAAPVIEEVLFRGFVYAGLRRSLNAGSAAVLSALGFAAVHFPAGATQFILLVALGVALSLLYERTRSLWPGIVLHVFHNILFFSLALAVLAL